MSMHRPPPARRKKSDEQVAGACLGVGCVGMWLLYAALVVSGVVALVIILWKVALG